jgi:hypothetical protein
MQSVRAQLFIQSGPIYHSLPISISINIAGRFILQQVLSMNEF